MSGQIISISNQKGGVGKTTTAVNLSSSLALLDKKVLLVDLDPQTNASSAVGVSAEDPGGQVYQALIGNCSFSDIVRKTKLKNLFLAPSHPDLVGAEIELRDEDSREYILSKCLGGLNGSFDYIIIDCPPSLGLLTLNALSASDSLLIPVQCEYFALEGLKSLLGTFELVKRRLNSNIRIEGFLLTMYDPRTRLSNDICENIRSHFGKMVFDTIIPRNIRLSEAQSFGLPICLYDVSSKGAQHYLMLAKEMIERYRKCSRNSD